MLGEREGLPLGFSRCGPSGPSFGPQFPPVSPLGLTSGSGGLKKGTLGPQTQRPRFFLAVYQKSHPPNLSEASQLSSFDKGSQPA